jgi:hypothetical protein
MTYIINRKTTRGELEKSFLKIKRKKTKQSVNLDKYCGILKLKETPLEIQKKLRDEWQ